MKIVGLIWLEEIVEKLEVKHQERKNYAR